MTAEVRARKAAQDAATSFVSDTAAPVALPTAAPVDEDDDGDALPPAAAFTDTPPVLPAKMSGLDLGPACSQCGGMMQRTGACYTCTQCGNNTGCG